MRTCTLIFTLCLFSTLQVNGQKTVDQKIEDDILVIDDMLDDLEGYKMVDSLKKIVEEYRVYWNTTIGPPSEDDLKDFYVTIGEKLLEFAPVYDADFKSDLIDLKNSYEDIEPSPKELKKLRKNFKNFKKAHEKNKPNNIDKIKIANLIRQYEKAGGRRDISIGDILREGGQLILVLDDYADRFGKLDSLSYPEMDALKANPIDFISGKTDEHITEYKRLKNALANVKKETVSLEKYQDTIRDLTHSIERTNQALSDHNKILENVRQEKERAINRSTNKQNELNQKLAKVSSQLSKYGRDLQAKINERDGLLADVEELKAELKSTINNFESSYKELEQLQTISIQLKTDTAQLRADTANLQAAKAKIEKDKQTLFDEKERAENGRLIFLISSIVLLLGLLSIVLRGQWLVKKENKALSEEKALLEKNIEYTEGFYDEYRKTTKAEIAIQREELKEQKEQLEGKNKQLEKKDKQNEIMLRELNHRTKNNLQTISSILGIQSMKTDNKSVKDILKSNKSRVRAIGLIHKGLYTEAFDDQVQVKMKNYVSSLVKSLKKSFQFETEMTINNEVENIFIQPDKALPIALIINEVIANAFKYAFINHTNPKLNITFGYNNSNRDKINLKIEDNGKIASTDNQASRCPRDDYFSTLFVKLWVTELEGKCGYDKTPEGGLRFILSIPNK